jgi:hypothetical protein
MSWGIFSDGGTSLSRNMSQSFSVWVSSLGMHIDKRNRFIGLSLLINRPLDDMLLASWWRRRRRRRSLFKLTQPVSQRLFLVPSPVLDSWTDVCFLWLLLCGVCWASSLPRRRVCLVLFLRRLLLHLLFFFYRRLNYVAWFSGCLFTQPGEQAPVFMSPRGRVARVYPQTPGTHFSRLLRHAWPLDSGAFWFIYSLTSHAVCNL